MPQSPSRPLTKAARLADAQVQWAELVAARPDLEPAVALQRRLLGELLDLAEAVERGALPRLTLPPRYLAAKLARGVPALAGEPVPLPVAGLAPAMPRLCDALAEAGAGLPAARIRAVLTETRIDAGSLLAASFARNQQAVRAAAVQHDLSADLLWLVAELAASPFAHAMQRRIFPAEVDPVWQRGKCPACGSWPALAEVVDGVRVLRCSFCALGWSTSVAACAYCGESAGRFAVVTPDDTTPGRRVETCAACKGYLKSVASPRQAPFPLVAVSDLASTDLDVWAMEHGFARPQLQV